MIAGACAGRAHPESVPLGDTAVGSVFDSGARAACGRRRRRVDRAREQSAR